MGSIVLDVMLTLPEHQVFMKLSLTVITGVFVHVINCLTVF